MASTYPPLNPSLSSGYGTTNTPPMDLDAEGTAPFGNTANPMSFGGDISSSANYVPIIHPLQSIVIKPDDASPLFIPEGTLVVVQGLPSQSMSLSAIHLSMSTVNENDETPFMVRPLAADLKIGSLHPRLTSVDKYNSMRPNKSYVHYVSVAFGGVQSVVIPGATGGIDIKPGEKVYYSKRQGAMTKNGAHTYIGKALLQVYRKDGDVGDTHAMVNVGV